MVAVLEIIHSVGDTGIHMNPCNLTASSAARLESSLPEPPRARLSARRWGHCADPKVQATLSPRWTLSRQVPGQDMSFVKITLGTRESRSRGLGGEAPGGVPRRLSHPGEGGGLSTQVSVSRSLTTPDHPPFHKLNEAQSPLILDSTLFEPDTETHHKRFSSNKTFLPAFLGHVHATAKG